MISLLVPTRGRPESMQRFCEACFTTAHHPDSIEVLFYIDSDDEVSLAYMQTVAQDSRIRCVVGPRIYLAEAWNVLCRASRYDIVMQTGDDAVFKTEGWDSRVLEEFKKFPDNIVFVYVKDGIQNGKVGTLNFVHKDWVHAVGYYLPPYFYTDFNDLWLTEVAKRIKRAVYLEDVFIQHLHPAVGTAILDKTHQERIQKVNQTNGWKIYKALKFKRKEDATRLKGVIKSKR
jgi:hypothetical protein